MNYLLSVSTPSGGSMVCAYVYPACDVLIGDMTLYVGLLPLSIDHFDYILGIDWLTKYCASIDCVNKFVVFRPPGMPEFVFTGNGVVPPLYLISVVKVVKLLRKGCGGYLCCVLTASSDDTNLETILVVCEFPDGFPNDLLGDLVDMEIEFTIEEKNEIEIMMREHGGILAVISAQLAIIEEIKEKQCKDESLRKIVDEQKLWEPWKANTIADALSRKSIENL
ncbi:uncharacterized protein LOC114296925 [Camellia sinensis]|uniref:uncharacterized protein LOC114296925 n=1 Tax=Camellia sinensis TaxID=4442 RepID=UPI0010356B88|nr:uncharacterized protein LOC114296925 [Camellia sinensis]